MKNTLVLCGGTGAHVALALVRLHTLGHALGFFRHSGGKPLAFPALYLVDQDFGDGSREPTAWQLVRRFVAAHPGRRNWQVTANRSDPPELKTVTPLPIGSDGAWFNPPYDTLDRRFDGSPWLDLLVSQPQRDIRFSHGMMGSPAVGSLLFRLKEFDARQQGANHDGIYRELLDTRGRVAVVGSAVGGTGASVGPTLAQRFADADAEVMAVMVLNWFRFDPEGLDEETLERAQLRDRAMVENANSAFAYYGHRLAHRVATVPVGMPDSAIKLRRYTSDTQQPIRESFVHGVAALCCLDHFLSDEPYSPGLYQMGAEDPTRLGGRNRLPGGAGEDTVQSLANRAATLAATLEVFATTLSARRPDALFGVVPAIREAASNLGVPERVGQAVRQLVANYREHLKWMEEVLGVQPEADHSLMAEVRSRSRLGTHGLPPVAEDDVPREDAVALELFRWTASWVRDDGDPPLITVSAAPSVGGGYWPPLVGDDSLNVAAEHAGRLTRVVNQNIQGTVEGFIDERHVAQNGWPDPLAAADHFRYAIEHGHPFSRRQLEMLLAGVVTGKLTVRDVREGRSASTLSLDYLVREYRTGHLPPDFASVELVYASADADVVLGFNSPHTLLCPTPAAESDVTRERAWRGLWQALTGSQQPRGWRTEAIEKWAYAKDAVRKIRAWVEAQKKAHGGTAPPWTHVFEHESEQPPVPFGAGRTVSVYWGTSAAAPCVKLALPTSESGNYWPDQDAQLVPETDLLSQVPAIRKLRNEAGVSFELVSFETPGRDAPLRGFWREHLEQLQQGGNIAAFGAKPDDYQVAFQTADRASAAILDNVIVLDRDDIMVRDCSPLRQQPVPGSSIAEGRIRYPDYPLRSDYLGLVESDGDRAIHLLKRGEQVSLAPPSIHEGRQSARATWNLHMAGRSDVLPITLPVPPPKAPEADDKHHRAHWMVWPRFRSKGGSFWRAYYVYEHCTDARLHLSTLWLDPDDDCVRRCPAPSMAGSHPIHFRTGDRRAHTGGPPLAFSAENSESGQELGLYIVNLESLPQGDAHVKLGLDFGTSHTVASVRVDRKKELVTLSPEIPLQDDALTLHVSENWPHVKDAFHENGLQALGNWLPTYTDEVASKEAAGLVPSELLTIRPLPSLVAEDIAQWQPGRDCVIPQMNMQRPDLADHMLADFKWEASHPAFRGKESVLREIYLGMAIELAMADVVWRTLSALPAQADFTFTYPLRTSAEQLKGYQSTLRRVLDSGAQSFGFPLGLVNDIGIYNESSAARGGTRLFGEVCLVGDLGGGTLDLFISAYGGGGVDFEEVADSARIGGNELLRTMAEHADQFLPHGWAKQTDDVQTQLRAWMRSKGATRLFGDGAGEAECHDGLNVRGFAKAAAARFARELNERYFRLIVEYMARSLVAFLVRHWYPQVLRKRGDHDSLKVLVQLRGNGWRLWHGNDRYPDIEKKVAADVQARARELWRDRNGDRDAWHGLEELWREHGLWKATGADGRSGPTVDAPTCTHEGSDESNPKAAPILRVVGDAERHDDIRSYSHALVQLGLLRHYNERGQGVPDRIRWFDRLPVRTGGSGVKVEFRDVEPPFSLSHPDAAGTGQTIDDLEPELKHHINKELEEQGFATEVDFNAPIAALVWEAVFKSRRFLRAQ